MDLLALARQHDLTVATTQHDLQKKRAKKHQAYTRGQPSLSAGCHPNQIAKYREYDKKAGVPTEYTADGSPIITSMRHQAAYCRAHGLHNNDGIFS